MKLDQLANQDIGQRVLCRPRAQKVLLPARHAHMMLHRIRHRYMHSSISVYMEIGYDIATYFSVSHWYIPI